MTAGIVSALALNCALQGHREMARPAKHGRAFFHVYL
jgi:hypothetical protein